jgi:hypothetical protein
MAQGRRMTFAEGTAAAKEFAMAVLLLALMPRPQLKQFISKVHCGSGGSKLIGRSGQPAHVTKEIAEW